MTEAPEPAPLPGAAEHSLDVPVRPIRPRTGRDVRAWIVGIAALAIVGTAGGFAALSRPAQPETAIGPGPSARPTPARANSPVASGSPRVEVLPDVPNDPIAGAPSLVFFRREGDDAEVRFWLPGERGLRPLWTIPDGFAEIAASPLIGVLSPDKRSLFVRGFDSSTSGQPDRGRLTSLNGVTWTTSRLGGTFGWAWSADSGSLVVSAGAATWLLVEFDDGTARETEIVIDPGLEPLRPRQPGLDAPRVTPAGFSTDGHWIYGLRSRGDGTFAPAVRVSVADGSVETVRAFPTEGPEAIRLSDELLGTLDPITSRSIDPRSLGFLPERPGQFHIHEADGSLAWSLEVNVVLSASWIGDGRLLISEATRYPNPTGTEVLIVNQDGTRGPSAFSTGPVTGTSVASVFEGYALVGVVVEEPTETVLVCVLRLSDFAISGIRLSGAELAGVQLGGWLP